MVHACILYVPHLPRIRPSPPLSLPLQLLGLHRQLLHQQRGLLLQLRHRHHRLLQQPRWDQRLRSLIAVCLKITVRQPTCSNVGYEAANSVLGEELREQAWPVWLDLDVGCAQQL